MNTFNELISEVLKLQNEQNATLSEMREILKEVKADLKSKTLLNKEMLSLEEVSIHTGLSKSDLYKRTANRSIPHYCPSGKLIFFKRVDVEAWLMKNKISTLEEIQTRTNQLTFNSKN
ncbi:MAG: DNA-binding protein [Bacteroidetes bacterium HGW-Bacteroidetes-16]|jgi:excisionase family DNA binding protein|nr:MAG: DNA-binding protein [Bacteroidetes bacterium HGW-Bacteroidetes-16]